MLLTFHERDLLDIQIFPAVEKAQETMIQSYINKTAALDDERRDSCGLDEYSAWCNISSKWDWKIIRLTADRDLNITAKYTG